MTHDPHTEKCSHDERHHDERHHDERRSYDEQLAQVQQDVADLRTMLEPVIEIWITLQGLVKFLRWLGIGMKWLVTIAGGFALIWAAFVYIVQGAIHRGG